ncbi:FG-GAP-like repeat-containing protein [Lentzea sp. NBRC 105346]|uniref:FG-GAP-like repeat-containing protein n=1 Tax=Lentzea sp. NBRC 105346 TaxID=3032205 RepID=UPI0025579AEC|nr:FG-GAP-like repeat-containing protein [Lentzea sp. NBRC 105346]
MSRALRALLVLVLAIGASVFTGQAAFAGSDDYPSKWKTPAMDTVVDDWGMYNRECTSFVAYRLSTRNGYNMPWHDNAINWANRAKNAGVAVDHLPAKGAVAWFSYGHVAWVESVSADKKTVHIEEYNYDYAGHYNQRDVAVSKVSNFIHFADINPPPPPPSPPDSDGDGVLDSNDPCPNVYVADADGCPGRSDYSLDGKSDIAAFYNYDGGATNLWLWNGQADRYSSGPYAPWTQATGFEASRLNPVGTGDYDGDKIPDTAAFYGYDNGALALDIWYGNPRAGLDSRTAWYVGNSWEGARVIPAGGGDFNQDGKADVAAFYRYDNAFVALYVWYGQADRTMSGPYTVWTGNGWDGSRIITVGVGDTDGDGKADISTFYRHDGGMMDQNVWYGDGAGNFTLGRPWHVDTSWEGARFIPAGVADLNSDGKADTIAFYRQDNMQVDMRVWYGTSSRVGAADPGGPWSGFNGWDGNRILPAGTGDYNGDGKIDVATFYRHDGQMVDMNIWYGDGGGNLSLFRAWHVDTAWEGARIIPAK